jgi:hypothetical protein
VVEAALCPVLAAFFFLEHHLHVRKSFLDPDTPWLLCVDIPVSFEVTEATINSFQVTGRENPSCSHCLRQVLVKSVRKSAKTNIGESSKDRISRVVSKANRQKVKGDILRACVHVERQLLY